MRWPGWGRSGLARAGEPGPGAPARWDVCGGAWELPGGAGRLGLRALLLGRLGACVGSRPCTPAQPRVSEPWEPADRICEMGVITASPLRQRQPRPGAHCPHALRPPSRRGGRGRLGRGCLEACSPAFCSRFQMAHGCLSLSGSVTFLPGRGARPRRALLGGRDFLCLVSKEQVASPSDPGRLAAELWATAVDLGQAKKRKSVVCAQVRLAPRESVWAPGGTDVGARDPAGSAPAHGVLPVAPSSVSLRKFEFTLIPISNCFEGQTEISSHQTTLLPDNLPTHLPSA